jgi:hypothetical protein
MTRRYAKGAQKILAESFVARRGNVIDIVKSKFDLTDSVRFYSDPLTQHV